MLRSEWLAIATMSPGSPRRSGLRPGFPTELIMAYQEEFGIDDAQRTAILKEIS